MCGVSSCFVLSDYEALEVITNPTDLEQLTLNVVMKLDLNLPSQVICRCNTGCLPKCNCLHGLCRYSAGTVKQPLETPRITIRGLSTDSKIGFSPQCCYRSQQTPIPRSRQTLTNRSQPGEESREVRRKGLLLVKALVQALVQARAQALG